MLEDIVVIMGPTASGKSSIAIELAIANNCEIISADSMQLYKEMSIGTAKPTNEDLNLVPHHLIDEYSINDPVDVFKYVHLAEKKIREISKKGITPIVVGGTGMYIRSLLYGLDPMPADREVRKQIDEQYDSTEGFLLLKKYMSVNVPEDFKRWAKHQRKLLRALEVYQLTGKSITELQTLHKPQLRYNAKVYNLCWDREVLKKRIRERTTIMLENGWIEETKEMIKNNILNTPTARQVLGYSIINEYLTKQLSYDEMREKIITKTWQYARRQITWFKNKHPEAIKIKLPHDLEKIKI